MYHVACDAQNNIYVNGQTDTITFYNIPRVVTIKYNSAGQQQWFKKEVNRTYTLPHFHGDFKVDAIGNSYVACYVNKNSIDDDWVVTKYGNAGGKKWSVTYNDSVNASDRPFALAVDKDGNAWVSGYIYNGTFSLVTQGYNKAGEKIFSDIYKRKNANALAAGIGIDKNNNVYAGGSLGISVYPGSVVIKYGVKNLALAEDVVEIIKDLRLFPNPAVSKLNINYTSSIPSKNYYLTIHDISGNEVLAKQIPGSSATINLSVDVSGLRQGIYTARITDGLNAVSKTFIKE